MGLETVGTRGSPERLSRLVDHVGLSQLVDQLDASLGRDLGQVGLHQFDGIGHGATVGLA